MDYDDYARRNLRVALAIREANSTETSKKAGLSPNVLGKYIRGETRLTYGNIMKICAVLNIPIGIVGKEESLTPERIRLHNILSAASGTDAKKIIDDVRRILD